MIKVIYLTSLTNILTPFVDKQIAAAKLVKREDVKFEKIITELNPEFVEFYKIPKPFAVIFEDEKGKVLNRIDGPFSTVEVLDALLASEMKMKGE